MSFYNTINEKGETLKESENKTQNQEEQILTWFKSHNTALLTAFEVQGYVFGNTVPVTSVRRALSDLQAKGKVIKTDHMRNGLYGKSNHCWKLHDNLKPQLDLFKDK